MLMGTLKFAPHNTNSNEVPGVCSDSRSLRHTGLEETERSGKCPRGRSTWFVVALTPVLYCVSFGHDRCGCSLFGVSVSL